MIGNFLMYSEPLRVVLDRVSMRQLDDATMLNILHDVTKALASDEALLKTLHGGVFRRAPQKYRDARPQETTDNVSLRASACASVCSSGHAATNDSRGGIAVVDGRRRVERDGTWAATVRWAVRSRCQHPRRKYVRFLLPRVVLNAAADVVGGEGPVPAWVGRCSR